MEFNAKEIKQKCNGMLSAEMYQRIYEYAAKAPAGNFIEIGAAHGAATVCLGLALGEKSNFHVYSVEKIIGGSRDQFGGFSENKKTLEKNLAYFGVENHVELILEDVKSAALKIPSGPPFSLMILDADGRINRDFGLFFDKLMPGAIVIIDDVSPGVRIKPLVKKFDVHQVKIDQKHRISSLLLDVFCRHGLVEGELVGTTFFGKKLSGGKFSDTSADVLEAYHHLVFAEASYSIVPGGVVGVSKRLVARFLPDILVEKLRNFVYW